MKCPHCGETLPAKKRTVKGTRAISLGRGPTNGLDWQKREYMLSMQVKRGAMVWSPHVNPDRFGARGGFVLADRAHELAAHYGDVE